ncbi:MAG: hypothetical protein KGZ58_01950 [Ignavibacteriales bacterium]|nr:hypothetical protein [Ignavibacteriales bacterium]
MKICDASVKISGEYLVMTNKNIINSTKIETLLGEMPLAASNKEFVSWNSQTEKHCQQN